jgi:hypothetical protein
LEGAVLVRSSSVMKYSTLRYGMNGGNIVNFRAEVLNDRLLMGCNMNPWIMTPFFCLCKCYVNITSAASMFCVYLLPIRVSIMPP